MGIDQRRDIQARIELAAVLALHTHLKAANDGLARQLFAQLRMQIVVIVVGPVGVGGIWPTRSCSLQPVIWQKAAFT
jgi:hypothetical protein